jgi:SAM-dependent methyltransferase
MNPLDEHLAAYTGGQLYDFDNHLVLEAYTRRILSLVGRCERLLEYGIGHGVTVAALHAMAANHDVVDASPAVIAHFRQRFPDLRVRVLESYFENLPAEPVYDVIVMGFVLEHVEDPVAVLRGARRMLRPGGTLFVAVPNAAVLNRRIGKMAGLLADLTELSDHDRLLGHRRYYTVDTLRADLAAAGLRDSRMEGIFLKPLTSRQMQGLSLPPDVLRAFCDAGREYPELSCAILAQVESD